MTLLAHKTPTRIRILESCTCSSKTVLPAGANLELLPGATWPPQVREWLASGLAVPLDPAISVPTLSRVGAAHFEDWFREPATPPAAAPPLSRDDICKMYGLSSEQFEWCCLHSSFPPAWFPGAHNLSTSVVTRTAVRDAAKVREWFAAARAIFGG